MSLIDKFEEVFLEEFSKLNIDNVDDYVKENHKEFLFLYGFKEGFKEKIEEDLGKLIIKRVRENYYSKLCRGISPEFLEYPKYLVYALQQNSFSFDELRKINLGEDSWRMDFIRKYPKENLLKIEFQKRFIAPFE